MKTRREARGKRRITAGEKLEARGERANLLLAWRGTVHAVGRTFASLMEFRALRKTASRLTPLAPRLLPCAAP